MKTSLISMLMVLNTVLFILIGCDPLENGLRRSDTTTGTAERVTDDGEPKHLYVSGISYPEGYDWRRDTAYGRVECNIFLMRDGEVVRMSKRTGKAISLSDLLDEVPVDAARFFFNLREPNSHFQFDLDLAVNRFVQPGGAIIKGINMFFQ